MEKDIEDLLRRYRTNQCSDEERRLVEQVYMRHMNKEPYVPDDAAKAAVWGHLQTMRDKERNLERRRIWLPRMGSAAAVLLIAAAALYFIGPGGNEKTDPAASTHVADIHPGGNRATLTLSDGRTVDLSSEQTGIIVGDGITYADGSEILDDKQQTADNKAGEKESLLSDVSHLLSLSTPKGGQYQVILPDGTRVWLNAASSLKYPSSFVGAERVVELDGEGYFQVSEKSDRPFRVLSRGQQINVLGTEFNVSAYSEQGETITTLVSGAVKVQSALQAVVLQPGRQSRLTESGRLVSAQVDLSSYVAWKWGIFYFNRTPFEEVMRQLARWYDIEVIYKGSIPQETFSGKMSRNVRLSSVLKLIKGSGAVLRLQDGQLIIE